MFTTDRTSSNCDQNDRRRGREREAERHERSREVGRTRPEACDGTTLIEDSEPGAELDRKAKQVRCEPEQQPRSCRCGGTPAPPLSDCVEGGRKAKRVRCESERPPRQLQKRRHARPSVEPQHQGRRQVPSVPPRVMDIYEDVRECDSNAFDKSSPDYQAKLLKLQNMCDAMDAEVASWSAVIRTLAAAKLSTFNAQMDLQLSKFSPAEQNMPIAEIAKSCPEIEAVLSEGGKLQLDRVTSFSHPDIGDSKRNLNDIWAVPNKNSDFKRKCSELFTPFAHLKIPGDYNGDSWADTNVHGLTKGTTPKSLRLPKHGETMLSINGSPLGQFGKTPTTAGLTRTTRAKSRSTKLKRSLRDL